MDVGNPSNFDRIMHLYGGDLSRLRQDLAGSRHSDDDTRGAIAQVEKEHGYLMDPHTAVGYSALQEQLSVAPEDTLGILLATAHPAKFSEVVEAVIGRKIPLPSALSSRLDLPLLCRPMEASFSALKRSLTSW
jgi:threonine synthase